MKFIDRIQKFMYGRYGPDDLYSFLVKLYIVILIIDLFVNFNLLAYLELLIVVVMLYRFFSKNIYKRREENKQFLKIKNSITMPFKTWIKHAKDKNNVYKKCYKCGTIIRLPVPNKCGIKHVKCPKCKKRQSVLCLKKEKVEVIKKEKRKGGKKDV